MGIPGRKPKPTESKRRAGNPGRRPLNDTEPTPPVEAPEMPEHFDAKARQTWQWLCEMLGVMGLLAKSNQAVMSLYCDTWSEYVKVRGEVTKFGMVLISPKTNMPFMSPYMAVESMLKKQLLQYLVELGLSPSAVSRVHVQRKDEQPQGKARLLKIVG